MGLWAGAFKVKISEGARSNPVVDAGMTAAFGERGAKIVVADIAVVTSMDPECVNDLS